MIDMLPAKISVPAAAESTDSSKDASPPNPPSHASNEAVDAIRIVDGKTTKMTNGKGLNE